VELDLSTVPNSPSSASTTTANRHRQQPQVRGKVVAPSAPRCDDGTYWGYTVRLADTLQAALDDCPFPGGRYDLKIGTSERGRDDLDDPNYSVLSHLRGGGSARNRKEHPKKGETFRHAIVVFGGVAGIEECVDADESMRLAGSLSHTLFDQWYVRALLLLCCSFVGFLLGLQRCISCACVYF